MKYTYYRKGCAFTKASLLCIAAYSTPKNSVQRETEDSFLTSGRKYVLAIN